jgi:hypothetical protein
MLKITAKPSPYLFLETDEEFMLPPARDLDTSHVVSPSSEPKIKRPKITILELLQFYNAAIALENVTIFDASTGATPVTGASDEIDTTVD